MNNQLTTLLNHWHPKRDSQQWVLGTIFYIKGSSYRKPGAMMLFGDMGEQYGLLSGGCLESNLMQHARKVMDTEQSKIVTYDMTDEDDVGWQLGIGCGGLVKILLQPLSAKNNYLDLLQVVDAFKKRKLVWYVQHITQHTMNNKVYAQADLLIEEHPHACEALNELDLSCINHSTKALLNEDSQGEKWLVTPIKPCPHIMIFGGGVDALPLTEIANTLGWQVTLVDKRPAYARKSHFPTVDKIIKVSAHELLADKSLMNSVDGVVIMTHNIAMDGEALKLAQHTSANYVGLLGPSHRRERILDQEKLSLSMLSKPLSSPIGLDIGGQLPESIALSILSECHQTLYK